MGQPLAPDFPARSEQSRTRIDNSKCLPGQAGCDVLPQRAELGFSPRHGSHSKLSLDVGAITCWLSRAVRRRTDNAKSFGTLLDCVHRTGGAWSRLATLLNSYLQLRRESRNQENLDALDLAGLAIGGAGDEAARGGGSGTVREGGEGGETVRAGKLKGGLEMA